MSAAAKIALRDQLLTARNRLSLAEVAAAGAAIAENVMSLPQVRRAASVAAYVSIGTEPGTGLLLEELRRAGKRVILPVLLPDNDLDWAAYDGSLVAARRGLLEPPGPRLGVQAIATPEVMLLPGLAVDGRGIRMGRGGGCYDRALARVPLDTFTCVLLHDGEVLDEVPAEPHDRAVAAAVTPNGLSRFTG